MFPALPAKFDFPAAERAVLQFWDEQRIFARSLEQRRAQGASRFVFYEGPPTANGLPHPGHALTRAIKDLFPRYQTMCGKLVERKAGWDTHGLPVEVEVCKELGIHTKEEIEAYGVEKFNLKCIQSVFRYTKQWEDMTRRLAFWVNLDEAYVTYHQSYVESVWWGLKQLFDRGLLYQGHKVVWWWAQGGTALSAGEVGEGYRAVDDPSVYVKFPLLPFALGQTDEVPRILEDRRRWSGQLRDMLAEILPRYLATAGRTDEEAAALAAIAPMFLVTSTLALSDEFRAFAQNAPANEEPLRSLARFAAQAGDIFVTKVFAPTSLLVWTTTPWTLISNHFAAVNRELLYLIVHDEQTSENYIVAEALLPEVEKRLKRSLERLLSMRGEALLGQRYLPPYFGYYDAPPRDAVDRAVQDNGGEGTRFGDLRLKQKDGGADYLGWRVTAADFVETSAGTGIVHIAPAFGEADFGLLQQERQRFDGYDAIPLLCAVAADGKFSAEAPAAYRGRWVKDCDKDIIRELKERGLLLHQEVYRHDYPFCPRAEEDALIQYARKSWFVRTSQFKDEFLANNDQVNWLPTHIKEGRFGDFLRNNVDWALSRERFWGTPLPVWMCTKTLKMEAVGSFTELKSKPGASDGGYWEKKVAEHRAVGEALPTHLQVHKPYIDEWRYDSPFAPGAKMERVKEVIDCWWDAGSMPFAQWGFPHQPGSVETFEQRFPADFISEAIDQTRGWFYGLLSISTLLFSKAAMESGLVAGAGGARRRAAAHRLETELSDIADLVPTQPIAARIEAALDAPNPPALRDDADGGPLADVPMSYPMPFRTCIVLGHMMGEDGLKMSKRKKNYKEPSYIFDSLGADAMRWYFFSAQAPWTTTRFVEASIRDAHRDFLVKLYNVLSFFNIYANIDGFKPAAVTADDGSTHARGPGWRPAAQRAELDRWVISELHRTIAFVREKLDAFENFPAAGRLNDFVDALSNWYLRRSRDRFWSARTLSPDAPVGSADQEKWDAYNTLYETLLALSGLIAPFTPYFAEAMYQQLVGMWEGANVGMGDGSVPFPPSHLPTFHPSVHLTDYPVANPALIDEALAAEMDLVRDIVSSGRSARTDAKLKVRQPLARVEIVLAKHEHESWLKSHAPLIAEELNVKTVDFATSADQYVTYQVKPNFKALGPKFGKLAPQIQGALKTIDAAAARRQLSETGAFALNVAGQDVQLTPDEVDVRLEAKPGWAAAQSRAGVIVLSTEVTPELRDEGLIRELIHHVQTLRKDANLAYEQRITLHVHATPEFDALVKRYADLLRGECLADEVSIAPAAGKVAADAQVEVEGVAVKLAIIAK